MISVILVFLVLCSCSLSQVGLGRGRESVHAKEPKAMNIIRKCYWVSEFQTHLLVDNNQFKGY